MILTKHVRYRKLAKAAGEEVDGKRKINYQIEKNLGMVKAAAKKAAKRNPRVKQREKYRKALIRRKGQVQEMRDASKRYSGEATGIRSNVVRSISLR
jgi:U3 small nucleolar RNA-associated protein 3